MPAVNRERKHNSNPMGKRKHWYVPCIAPALAALLLAGCGATVDLNEQATAETAMAVQWVPNGSVYATAAEELEYWSTAQKLESALAATRETAPPACSSCPMRSGCAARPMPEHWTWKMNCPTSSAAVWLIRRCKPITMPRPSRPKPPCVL